MAACAEALDRSDPGTRRLGRLEEDLGAASLELTAGDLRYGEVASWITIEGARYPEALEKRTGL